MSASDNDSIVEAVARAARPCGECAALREELSLVRFKLQQAEDQRAETIEGWIQRTEERDAARSALAAVRGLPAQWEEQAGRVFDMGTRMAIEARADELRRVLARWPGGGDDKGGEK